MFNFNINTAGFVIVGMFLITWAGAMLIWKYGHVEDKWGARLKSGGAGVAAQTEDTDLVAVIALAENN